MNMRKNSKNKKGEEGEGVEVAEEVNTQNYNESGSKKLIYGEVESGVIIKYLEELNKLNEFGEYREINIELYDPKTKDNYNSINLNSEGKFSIELNKNRGGGLEAKIEGDLKKYETK